MNNLHKQIKEEMRAALKEREELKLSVLRGLISSLTNEAVSKGRKPSEELSDDEVMAVIKREVKQRKDSIEEFSKGGREDLAKKEEDELKILEPYLPEMAGSDEIRKVAEQKIAELGISADEQAKKGVLVGAIVKEFAGNADGAEVKKVVDEIFGN